jgi:ADP-ribose pyrophosphatase YjhB (NUDIX family)
MPAMTELYHFGAGQNPTPTMGTFALILDAKARMLLCQRTDMDMWNLPGGGVESDEASWDTVLREVQERAAVACASGATS